VGRELNVDHILEGSVRKAGSRVRITAQLIDVSTGNHVWAERYDRELQDIFEVQDEITHHIVESLNVGLLDGEQARGWRRTTQNAEAYDYFLQGRHRWQSTHNRQGLIQARLLFEQAVALDGNFARVLAASATLCLNEARFGWSQSPQASLSQGFELAKRAIALDDSLDYAWGILAMFRLENREHDQALRDAERGVNLNPGGADVHTFLARAQFNAGNHKQALATSRKAAALTPTPTIRQLIDLGLHCLWSGSLEEARAALKQAVERTPDWISAHVILAAAHAAQGQEARGETQEILRLEPDFSLKEWVPRLFPFKYEEDAERMMELLRKAGLPE
jgi:adenylate cyclase